MSLYYSVHKYYDRIPNWVLRGMSSLYYAIPESKRYGGDFAATRKLLEETEFSSREKIEEMVNERFLHILREAWEHVPFYRDRYQQYGLEPGDIKDVRDIVKLPVIDKEEVRSHLQEMISDKYNPSQLMYLTTSGSTGNPLGFYQPKAMVMIEWAYVMHIWKRAGCMSSSSRLILRGKKLHDNTNGQPYFYDPLRRELSCDVFQLTEKNLEIYCQAIEKFQPEFIHGYMSAIMILAKYVETRGLKHHFHGILAVSETVYPDQRVYVEKVFETRVFSFYGHSERLVIAGECEKSSCYHVEPLYGYCELLNTQLKTDEVGEIVATGFLNETMPLIRYRTGDTASWNHEICSCGRQSLRLNCVQGRWEQDFIVNKDGALISMAALNIHSNALDRVIRYKLVQYEPGIVEMLILPRQDYHAEESEAIKKVLERNTQGTVRFDLRVVDDLPVMKNGKYKMVEQHLDISAH